MVEIGGGDINFGLPLGGGYVINVTIPAVIRGLADGIHNLYAHGARHVLLYNMPRADCSPNYLQSFQQFPVYHYNKDGCIVEIAQLISYFNSQLQALAAELTQEYPGLTVYYFDWFAANTYVLENMDEFGFTNSLQSCCGGGGKFNCDGDGLCGCAPLNHTDAVYTGSSCRGGRQKSMSGERGDPQAWQELISLLTRRRKVWFVSGSSDYA
ncbi:GDSL esterase/lipase At5g03980-like [Selaginella moellendorffii]|uniref:GDSL esterase/lipase At5g03980-like n=1 Tax=Selaginella moellendorffii TaxID=88036 RepID=UPI000D1CF715|nr:GDSL esterase/lipase At5g03980-like [Selaginella moellendorffii]|eukprot:XP_024529970.1 GDSL esterase/lipase At5g03980-like [Selaginella moellendorffii]